jgi:hypothetical protein
MELPAGGVFHGEIACGKHHTTYRKETPESKPIPYMACDKAGDDGKMGAVHATDAFPGPAYGESKSVKGTALGIAYNSDPHKVKPEDFVVISVNHSAPWTREVAFAIPAGLPACPAGGCHCMWGWIPDPMNVQQMYTLVYRCNVTGETGSEYPAPAQIARKCPFDKNNCTIGAKQVSGRESGGAYGPRSVVRGVEAVEVGAPKHQLTPDALPVPARGQQQPPGPLRLGLLQLRLRLPRRRADRHLEHRRRQHLEHELVRPRARPVADTHQRALEHVDEPDLDRDP